MNLRLFYAHWNFRIPFIHIFMCVGIFIFHSNISIFFVELFYSFTNNSPGVSFKIIFRQHAVFIRFTFKSQTHTAHIATIYYVKSKAFAQNPYMENVFTSFPNTIFVQKFACFSVIFHNNYVKKCNFLSEVLRRYG